MRTRLLSFAKATNASSYMDILYICLPCRSLVGKHPEMMRVNAEDPRFSLKFMAAMLDETVDEGKRGQKRIRS